MRRATGSGMAATADAAAGSDSPDGGAGRVWRRALPVASMAEKRRENESPDLERALLALPDYNVMAFLGRDPPGTLNHALNAAEAAAVCRAVADRVAEEAAARRALGDAGCPVKSRCALVLVAPAGAPANPAKPCAPEMRWVEEEGGAGRGGNVRARAADSQAENGHGEADDVRGWDDVVGMTAKYIQDRTDLTVHAMRCGPGESGSWRLHLARPEVVLVSLASDALAAFESGELSLDSVHLLVYDAADWARDSRDPAATLLQLALPSMELLRRPRVLALQRAQLEHPGDFAAVERSLGVQYVGASGFASRVFVDRPRLAIEPTAVAPANAPLTSVETLWYPRFGAVAEAAACEAEKVHVEVGPYGSFLYTNMHMKRRLRRRCRKSFLASLSDGQEPPEDMEEYLSEKGVSTYTPFEATGGREQLLGVSPKAMQLLDLLHTECALMLSQQACLVSPGGVSAPENGVAECDAPPGEQSGALSFNRSILIYSGSPAVTASLCELVKQVPGFAGVRSEVVMGDRDAARPWGRAEAEEPATGWQGMETDDEIVRDFLGGEVQLLFVASDNLAKITRRRHPMRLPGLVVCFDGKAQESVLRISTLARRRIIVFAPKSEKPCSHSTPDATIAKAKASVCEAIAAPNPARLDAADVFPSNDVSTGGRSTDEAENAELNEDNACDDVVGDKSQRVVTIMPPAALVGPDDGGGKRSYFYTITPDSTVMPFRDHSGVSSFVVVLSEELDEVDLTMQLGTDGSTVGAEKAGELVLSLKLIGSEVLSAEQVQLGRKFTAFFFRATSSRFDSHLFQWGTDSPNKGDRTRRYLVLPRNPVHAPTFSGVTTRPAGEGLLTGREKLSQYFPLSDPMRTGACAAIEKLASRGGKISAVDWAALEKQVDALKVGRDADGCEEQTVEAPRNFEFDISLEACNDMEGKLVSAVYDSKRVPCVSGLLDYRVCPLSKFTRQKGFGLDSDGQLIDLEAARQELSSDLVDLGSLGPPPIDTAGSDISVSAADAPSIPEAPSIQTFRKRPRSSLDEADRSFTGHKGEDGGMRYVKKRVVETLSMNLNEASSSTPAHPAGKQSSSPRAKRVFDAIRNKRKGRRSWFGPVVTTYAEYLAEHKNAEVRVLHQPLIATVEPEPWPVSTLLRVVNGVSLTAVADEFVQSRLGAGGDGSGLRVPEFLVHYPIPVQALLMPSVLMLLERHLVSCAFRRKYSASMNCDIAIPRLTCALTSSTVSSTENYERFELLGDSILKLSATVRLFVQHPHFAEGDMHQIRSTVVSNQALIRKAQEQKIEHFLNFTKVTLANWKPPGYERDAMPLPVHDKGLADVVEAVTGAFFLQGAADYAAAANCTGSAELEEDGDLDSTSKARADAVAQGILCGYKAGSRFLEAFGVLEFPEPSQEDILRSAIYAMLDPSEPVPEELKPSAFPRDERMLSPTRVWEEHVGRIEEHMGYKFKYRQLLYCALTHCSYAEAIRKRVQVLSKYQNFRRLEFLGDAVLDLCVSRYLFYRYPSRGPGDLTELKSSAVSNEAFARAAVENGFHECLYIKSKALKTEVDKFVRAHRVEKVHRAQAGESGSNEFWTSEREAPKVLSDIFEAVVGAVFVEAGLSTAWKVVLRLLGPTLAETADLSTFATHPVKVFQNYVTKEQRLSSVAPKYHLPPGCPPRAVKAHVYVHKKLIASGTGTSKKRAMCSAAVRALETLTAAEMPSSPTHDLMKNLRLLGDKERAEASMARRRSESGWVGQRLSAPP